MNAITHTDRFSSLPALIKERGGDKMMTIMFDEAEERGEIRGAIKIYDSELHLTPDEIVRKIMPRFSLNQREAKQYVETTLHVKLIS